MGDQSCSWWDPLDPAFLADPYPVYRRLRAQGPVLWHDSLNSWVVTGYESCERILRDWDAFASDFRRVGAEEPEECVSVQTLDPPEHYAVHRLLAEAVQAQDADSLASEAYLAAGQRLRELAVRGGDFVADVAMPVSIEAALRLLGVRPDDSGRVVVLSTAVVASMNAGLREDVEEAGRAARRELSDLVARWSRHPAGDGVASFIAAHRDRAAIADPVISNSLRVLLLAGINSAQRMLGLGLLTILRDTRAYESVTDAHGPTRGAAHELVRLDNPFQAQSRKCTRSIELKRVHMARGDTVVVLLGAANRDPAKFTEPDRFMPARRPNPHLGFGRGTHACLGAPAALGLLRATLAALATCGTRLALAGAPVFDQNPTLRGLVSLPVAPVCG
jgi:cytochrome P450